MNEWRWPNRGVLAVTAGFALMVAACTSPAPGASDAAATSPAAGQTPGSATAAPAPESAAPAASGPAEPSAAPLASDPLHGIVLTDVRTGEEVRLGSLAAEKPLLLETMAIWCSNCRAQQKNVRAAHVHADFHSISLDVDPGEQPDDLATYAEREDFDWHFAMADAELLAQLRERFGTAVAVPPSMPKILFRTDGTIEMIGLGELYSADEIARAVGG